MSAVAPGGPTAPVAGDPDPDPDPRAPTPDGDIAGIDVQIAASPAPAPERVSAWARAAWGDDRGSLCVRIVDEAEGAALNARFRARAGATNVLSFPADEAGVRGDIAVCAAVVAREAAEQHKSLDAHFAHMIVHGVLHLSGLDHDDDLAAQRMEARETAILGTLGFQDPYAPT